MKYSQILTLSLLLAPCLSHAQSDEIAATESKAEPHLQNIRQLTFGGDNAEGYFSPSGELLIFQSNNKKLNSKANGCDQMYMLHPMDENQPAEMISNGVGRTTCGYFLSEETVLYASTHETLKDCKPARKVEGKYVWELFPGFEIYKTNINAVELEPLTHNKVYDAEATVSPDGKTIVYTSLESGDLELWTMNADGTDKKQITKELGYDGGAFFSPDGQYLVFRASRPKTKLEKAEYKKLLADNLVAPTDMEIFVCKKDGSEMKQITHLGKANWAPFFSPSGKKIIFSSNHASEKGYDFQLYMINVDGTDLEQITFNSQFNAFPMFSPDGGRIVFASNRNQARGTHDTNLFIADWIE